MPDPHCVTCGHLKDAAMALKQARLSLLAALTLTEHDGRRARLRDALKYTMLAEDESHA